MPQMDIPAGHTKDYEVGYRDGWTAALIAYPQMSMDGADFEDGIRKAHQTDAQRNAKSGTPDFGSQP